ncbi:MAG: 16S rRNA (guanine(527)-N(7))-methyltransferase RsmG [Clostridia bacterium]|nr:16S rRNA (guanine(527)-N(7))-methyltransferase RsmG [Clostridia bacterium]
MRAAEIRERLQTLGLSCGESLAEQLECYLRLLLEWNQRMDLTAVTEEPEILERHFADSLTALQVPGMIPETGSLIDVGTGAGFPGMVLALARPDLRVTLLDALGKRLDFLAAVAEAVGARNVTLVHARAEDAARQPAHRGQYDRAAARAVAQLPVLLEYLLPYVRIGGAALCWKGPSVLQELEAGRRAAHLLGGSLQEPVRTELRGLAWDHLILPVEKKQKTPSAYPRKAGTPNRQPLGVKGSE